jgi:hypothetical protein
VGCKSNPGLSVALRRPDIAPRRRGEEEQAYPRKDLSIVSEIFNYLIYFEFKVLTSRVVLKKKTLATKLPHIFVKQKRAFPIDRSLKADNLGIVRYFSSW